MNDNDKQELIKLINQVYEVDKQLTMPFIKTQVDQNDQILKFIKEQKGKENKVSCDGKAFGEQYLPSVGIIRSIWFDKQSTISRPGKCLYGTAFLVSPRIIVSCTHNIYDPRQKRKADDIKFIPGQNGYNISHGIVYQCIQFNFLPFEKETIFDLNPTIHDLCIGRLYKSIELQFYIPLQTYFPPQHANLTIIAYPNKGYRDKFHNLLSICLDRRHSNGKMVAISNDIISYEIATEQGCSGGPILAKDQSKIYLVGMHSHSGGNNNKTNEGLFFSSKTRAILNFLMQSFQSEYQPIQKDDDDDDENNHSALSQSSSYEQRFSRGFLSLGLPPQRSAGPRGLGQKDDNLCQINPSQDKVNTSRFFKNKYVSMQNESQIKSYNESQIKSYNESQSFEQYYQPYWQLKQEFDLLLTCVSIPQIAQSKRQSQYVCCY